jgi:nitrite reductase/ring-hydroxylating ferredoxin subunit
MGKKPPSFFSLASFVVALVFASGCLAWRVFGPRDMVIPAPLESNGDQTMTLGVLFLALAGLAAIVLFHSKNTTQTAYPIDKNYRFRQVPYLTCSPLLRCQMRSKSYPASYPNGWYKLCESSDLAVGAVLELQVCGKVFCVFRGESGNVTIFDAYCIHLGANLAVGGKVVGDCLVSLTDNSTRTGMRISLIHVLLCLCMPVCLYKCAFHKWRFQADGKVAHIPYTDAKVLATFATKTLNVSSLMRASRLSPCESITA